MVVRAAQIGAEFDCNIPAGREIAIPKYGIFESRWE